MTYKEVKLKKKELAKNILTLAIATLLVTILLEVAIRAALPQRTYNECYDEYYKGGPGIEVELDAHLGWKLKANYSACRYQPDTNQIIKITQNSKGLRLPYEVPYNKGNKTRILLLGDSFTYGIYLDDAQTPTARMQEILGSEYEVIPLASVGYGTDQELLYLKSEGLKYKPDMVVLFFYQNDYSNNYYEVQNYAEKPLFFLYPNETLELKNYPTKKRWQSGQDPYKKVPLSEKSPKKAFLLKSHLYSLWLHNKNGLFKILKGTPKTDYYSAYKESDVWSVEKEYSNEMKYFMKLTARLIQEIKQELMDKNIYFVIVNIPSKLNADRDFQQKFVNSYHNVDERNFNFSKASKMLKEEAEKLNATYIDLTSVAEGDEQFFFKSDNHWSPEGVSKAIEHIYEELKRAKAIPENATGSKQADR